MTGATGYTGRAVVARLRAQGYETVAHVRPDSSRLEQWRERFEGLGAIVETAPWELEEMEAALEQRQPDLVFALLGTTRKRAKGDGMEANEAYERVDYGLTKLLLDACAKTTPKARFVYLSSAGVKPNTRNPYLAARAKLEAALRDGSQPFTIVRPSFITGNDRDEDRMGERVGAAIGNAALAAVGLFGGRRVRDRYRSMDARQLAEALVRVAADPDAAGAVLHGEQLRAEASS